MIWSRLGGSGITPSPSTAFGIKAGYRHRLENHFFDDSDNEDEWQCEVYEAAAKEARKIGARTVFDVGCGSGYKLVKHFAGIRTVGFDLEPTVTFLRQKYPDHEWRLSDFDETIEEPADIVICADVIEHVCDPDRLLDFLSRLNFRKLFLSTPERERVYGFDHSGPPRNKAHCREWTMEELKHYVGNWFDLESHAISNEAQATQLIVCQPKA